MLNVCKAFHVAIAGTVLITGCEPVTTEPAVNVTPAAEPGVAVFSFVSLDRQSEQTATALTRDLIELLDRSPIVKVLSRSDLPTSMQDSSKHHLWPDSDLISLIVEGSVVETADGTRIIVQLIDASSDAHVWSETYTLNPSDLTTIAAAVRKQVVLAAGRMQKSQ